MIDVSNFKNDEARALYLYNILEAQATGGAGDEAAFLNLHRYFCQSQYRDVLPQWLPPMFALGQFWGFIKPKFGTYAERRTYLGQEFAPLIQACRNAGQPVGELTAIIKNFGSDTVNAEWKKMLARATTDPDGAVTMARTLLESICKHILDKYGIAYAGDASLTELYRDTAKQLNISQDQHDEQIFKKILGGCSGVVDGLQRLRGKHGDAHGKGQGHAFVLQPRHAMLAVNAAATIALFLIDTFDARKG
ncbi:MAG: hypothetical protein A2521_10205 [Deltaproteobacteria bacterium RIFOXYD12_FULL_57_12]|nr:MAG: hypothetical protein A2521_10205 [Deltaproteobacteria bacterium RIFOXYD12_FULL_57_12]